MDDVSKKETPRNITIASIDQNMFDILNAFFELDDQINNPHNEQLEKYMIIRLVTIFEQLCRKIVERQIDVHDDIKKPKKIKLIKNNFIGTDSGRIFYEKCFEFYTKNVGTSHTDDVEIELVMDDFQKIDKIFTVGFLISMQYSFQNIENTKKILDDCKIHNVVNDENCGKMTKLFDIRHDLVHTVKDRTYIIRENYSTIREMIISILNKSTFGPDAFNIFYAIWLAKFKKIDKCVTYCHQTIDHLESLSNIHHVRYLALKKDGNESKSDLRKLLSIIYNLATAYHILGNASDGYFGSVIVDSYYKESIKKCNTIIELSNGISNNSGIGSYMIYRAYIIKGDLMHKLKFEHLDEILNIYNKALQCMVNNSTLNQLYKNLLLYDVYIRQSIILRISNPEQYEKINENILNVLDNIIQIRPDYMKYRYNKGIFLYDIEKYDESKKCFEYVIKKEPYYFSAHVQLAKLLSLKNDQNAISSFDKALQIRHDDFNIYYEKGIHLLYNFNKIYDAIKCFDNAINLNPKFVNSHIEKSICYEKLEQYEDALKCLDTVLNIEPYNGYAHFSKGKLLFIISKYDDAITCFDHVLKICQNINSVNKNMTHHSKGNALFKQKKYDKAIHSYDEALKSNNFNYISLLQKAITLYNLNKFDESKKCCDEFIHNNSSDNHYTIIAYRYKGKSLVKLLSFDEALTCFDKVINSSFKHPQAYLNKGDILLQREKVNDALRCYNAGISITNYSDDEIIS